MLRLLSKVFGAHQEESSSDRFSTLSRRLDDLESKSRSLTTEWLDTLDRIEHILGRLTKRSSRAAAAAGGGEAAGGEAPPSSPAAVSSITERVMSRRARHGGPNGGGSQ